MAAARPSRPGSSTSGRGPTRRGRFGSRPPSVGSPATGRPPGLVPTYRRRPDRGDARHGSRPARPRRRGVPACPGDHGGTSARAETRDPPGWSRHPVVRAGRPRHRRGLRRGRARRGLPTPSPSSCRCTRRSRRSRSSSCSPRRSSVHLGWLRQRGSPTTGPTFARAPSSGLLLPSTAYVTGLRARNWARGAVGARAGGGRPARRAGRVDGRDPPGRQSRPTTGCRSCPTTRRRRCSAAPGRRTCPAGSSTASRSAWSLTGRPGDDDLTLRAAEEFQRATDWHLRSPVDGAPGEVLVQPTPPSRRGRTACPC